MTATPFDVRETDRLLTTTRSVRRRLDFERPVPREVIEEALEVAVQAPTANNQQNWRWVVITEDSVKKELAELFHVSWRFHQKEVWTASGRRRRSPQAQRNNDSAATLAKDIARVPVLVIPCVLGRPPDIGAIDAEWLRTRPGNAETARDDVRIGAMRASIFYGSIFPAIWSFQLALRSRGLGSTITCMHLPFERRVGELLGIPAGVTQVCMVPVAYTIGTDFKPAKRHPARSRTSWERWQA
ncbi:nitroreductase family protein [Saccharomonospora viridis]|jgi:nitroreductase|uniref:Nitroreductase n=2 Tax=Saccharomonospora viridis TaxID=1852 RepID=C7MX38_SACVD|nr:nitroreductase family protein [Saccharomonospora viridis]ACU97955.1 nitroreductase [Saccharomonospora viridis DSM 43017]KHF45922.1 nitroreductase [Saccharomonospora viridis]SFP39374.1 Nitroreductase [Saccharomonospora viridis]